MLVREFIRRALTSPTGYFSRRARVGRKRIDFANVSGEAEYRELLSSSPGEFLTPSEIFAPYYSYAIADWIKTQGTDHVIEIGGGSGSNARHILEKLHVKYTNIEVSPKMAEVWQRNVPEGHVILGDVTEVDIPEGLVVALEILDNLPHDKIRGSYEIHVERGREVERPLQDAWIRKAARPSHRPQFVPTGALMFFDKIKHHKFFIADFDALPILSYDLNAPLVAADDRDLPSYLHATGNADIFFATDFEWLQTAIGRPTTLRKSKDFFAPYAAPCRTQSGYNPLLDDFTNTSVLTCP